MGRIGLAFLVGVCILHTAPSLPAALWAYGLGAALLIAITLRARATAALLAGIAWAWAAAAVRLADDLPATMEGEDIVLAGYIASLPEVHGADAQFLLDVVEGPHAAPARVQLSWYRAERIPAPGELWRFTVRLKRRNGFANPGGFDYERRLLHEGVGATGYVREQDDPARIRAAGHRYLVLQLRAWIAARVATSVGAHPMLGVVQGLVIGDTRAMDAAQWRVFAATGTTHLMAISGLHISMVAALFAWFGGVAVRCWSGAQARGWSVLQGQVIAGALAAVAYAVLAGLSIPTQRTLIMLAIYFAARWRRRELAPAHALGLALIGVLLVDPFAPLAAGAWLSFGAVAVILLAVTGRLRSDNPLQSFGRVQWALTLGLTPFLLAAFGSVSLVAPAANLAAVPVFTLVTTPTALLGALAACVSPAAGALLLQAPLQVLDWLWPVLSWLAEQPLALWRFPATSWGAFLALCAGALLLAAPGVWPLRVLGVLLCLPAVASAPARPAQGEFELAILDVGQGLATVVLTESHALVYDAGPAFQSGRDTGELVAAPYLFHRGVRGVDVLVVSHGDLDHQGGVDSIAKAVAIGAVLRGPSVQKLSGARCVRGQRWRWDGVDFAILHPSADDASGENDSSCVLRIDSAHGSALLTGDIEARAEATLVQTGLQRADVVVAPHHGSRTSSTEAFTAALRPQIVVFSTGYRNRWGFPKQDVQERWLAVGARAFDTAQSGAIEIHVGRGVEPNVREHRRAHARYWRR